MKEGIIEQSIVNFTIDFSLHQKLRQINNEGLDYRTIHRARVRYCYSTEGCGFDSRWSHWNFSFI